MPRLLIVDDEADIRDSLSRHFRFLDYDVETAANGVEALEIMRKRRFQVVISDIMMPKMDGIDLLRQVRSNYPMTHVVMITGYVTMENILSCMRHGADTCVFKPIEDITELETAVSQASAMIDNWRSKLKQLTGMSS
ncbi:MAG: response regulator [Candidatus Cloacimonetes bacterium]|nr:response regulator [Candidatus Cloacimonadota bacterium]